jgi:hypothetical protein
MRCVIIESPYSGNVKANTAFARACVYDALMRGESPIASHLLYTQMLDDTLPAERELGIRAGLAWLDAADATVVYTNLGVTEGMKYGIHAAKTRGVPVEYRVLKD